MTSGPVLSSVKQLERQVVVSCGGSAEVGLQRGGSVFLAVAVTLGALSGSLVRGGLVRRGLIAALGLEARRGALIAACSRGISACDGLDAFSLAAAEQLDVICHDLGHELLDTLLVGV